MKKIKKFERGCKEIPITNARDLYESLRGRRNVIIYVKGNFELDEFLLFQVNSRGIELRNVDEDNE